VTASLSPVSKPVAAAPMSAARVLIFGGILLMVGGMLFGDIFAVFLLHQNAGQTSRVLMSAAEAVRAHDSLGVTNAFGQLGPLLEDHGTKVDAHVHMTDAGYLALLLALVQPYVALSQKLKKRLASLFVIGGALLPIGIFLIHYVGLTYSPFSIIGWASILADSAGALLIAVLVIELWAVWKFLRENASASEPVLPAAATWEQRVLLSGGTALILAGFLYGAWYAGIDLYAHEARETRILHSLIDNGTNPIAAEIADYEFLAAEKAVRIAAHSHIIEFGLLAMLLSFVQPYVYLRQRWKRRWIAILLAGSLILPVFVLLELKLGLVAAGIADLGGLMVIVALLGIATGVVRHTGALDRVQEAQL
jgi:hypothetical protein